MVVRVKLCLIRPSCVLSLLVVVACKAQGDPFLPLIALCPRRAEDLCAARAECCEGEEPELAGCLNRETALCDKERAEFEREDLDYSSVEASRTLEAQQAALYACEPAFSLSRFFQGGLAVDAACERDSQCESGLCGAESGLCESSEPAELCSGAE